jgi:hypothetical protein
MALMFYIEPAHARHRSMFNDQCSMINDLHHRATGSSQQQSDDITDRLKDHLNRLVHTLLNVLNGE